MRLYDEINTQEKVAATMASKKDIDIAVLRGLLEYDPETGELTWKERPIDMFQDCGGRYSAEWCQKNFNNKHAGEPAFACMSSAGYLVGGVLRRLHSAHRVAWAIHYGEWPKQDLDHINRDRADNRIVNLREASVSLNGHNKTMKNSSPYTGVNYYKPTGKWTARISKDRKTYCLGTFSCPREAALARDRKARELYGKEAFQNFPE